MLLLVMSLGLVVVLMMEARKPDNWRWIDRIDQGKREDVDSGASQSIDTRLRPEALSDAVPDSFVSPAPMESEEVPPRRYFRGVKPTYLNSIHDDTTFRHNERDAWFHLLEILDKNDEATLRKASTGRRAFVQLFEQSDEYRGELVTVRGTMRRANRLSAPTNDYGIKNYYQTWVTPDDSRNNLFVIYCLHLPKKFPSGMQIEEDVEVTGFYFKRWAYKAQGAMWTAPTLLARTVRWLKRPAVEQAPREPVSVFVVVAVALALSVPVIVYVWIRTRRIRPTEPDTPPDLDMLAGESIPSDSGPLFEKRSDEEQE